MHSRAFGFLGVRALFTISNCYCMCYCMHTMLSKYTLTTDVKSNAEKRAELSACFLEEGYKKKSSSNSFL
jgi:hypothetical protein